MARGWESKSVEAQMDAARGEREAGPGLLLDAEQAERLRCKQGLELSRRRILHEMEASRNPRHRKMLEEALAGLEAQLRGLA